MNKETLLMRYNDFEETKYLQEFISEEGRRKGTEALQEELKIDIDSFENVRKGGQEGVFSFDITKKKFNDFINYAIQEESKSTSEYERVLEFIKQRGASCIKFASHDKRIFATEDSNSNVEIFLFLLKIMI